MESNVIYNGESMELVEDFIDIGYMAENIEVKNLKEEEFEIKRSHPDKSMTLFISAPNAKDGFLEELLKVDELMHHIQVPIHCYYIFDPKFEDKELLDKLKKFEIVLDSEDQFGEMYGTKIASGLLTDKLTKSLFLISKDGAIFYLDMSKNLADQFDLERLRVELNKAYASYTGIGCHG
jgi:peroxiredoxin